MPRCFPRSLACVSIFVVLWALPMASHAAEVDGRSLSAWWSVPFIGLLLSIAVMPLVAPHFWHHHYGKVSAAWALAFLLPFAMMVGQRLTDSADIYVLQATPLAVTVGALDEPANGLLMVAIP